MYYPNRRACVQLEYPIQDLVRRCLHPAGTSIASFASLPDSQLNPYHLAVIHTTHDSNDPRKCTNIRRIEMGADL